MTMTEQDNLPRHVAIIMDGNGRWAKERGLPRSAGHRQGIKRVEEIVEASAEMGLKFVTFFAFSSENWSRPKSEIGMLMRSLSVFLDKKLEKLDKNNIRFITIGREDPVPGYVQAKLRHAQRKTSDNTGLTIILALNYGSRQEIVDAAKQFADDVVSGRREIDALDPELFNRYLYTRNIPDPDLLIRTSGEMRISNFLLWQISYAELYFPDKYWPDFKKEDLREALDEFLKRERRFGGLKKDVR